MAISVSNDDAAKLLAIELGAKVLLDKAKMATELVAAIFLWCTAQDEN